jgi:hypothetical protein
MTRERPLMTPAFPADKEAMHDLFTALAFVSMVFAPAIVAAQVARRLDL